MNKREKLYRIFNYGFSAWMLLLVAISLLSHDNPFLNPTTSKLLLTSVCAGAVLLGAAYLWHKKGQAPKREWCLLGVLFGIYFLLQLFVAIKLQVLPIPTWDYPIVYCEAANRVLSGVPPTDYFANFPNNTPYYWLLCGYFTVLHWFGVQDFMMPLLVLNSLCINVALLLLYKMAKRVVGAKWAVPVLLLGFFSPALLLYVPIAYTDTLSLPFVCGAAYVWLLAREANQNENTQKAIWLGLLAVTLTAMGAALKMSVAVLAIAFLLDALILWRGKATLKCIVTFVLCFVVLLGGINKTAQKAMPVYDTVGIPHTHWVMMGLHGDGSYYNDDYELTLSYDTYEERVAFTKQEIVRRVKEMGPIGLLAHFKEKLAFMISDGTYYAPAKIDRCAKKPCVWHRFVVPNGQYTGFLCYLADALQICLLAFCAVGSWRAAKTGENTLTVYRMAWFGLMLFLLLWENRSRYLVNFIPLFLLCAGEGLCVSTVRKEK